MNISFKNISYLKSGNKIQKNAFHCLKEIQIFEKLSLFQPVLTGTIPVNINIDSSDLDIICNVEDFDDFTEIITHNFGKFDGFKIKLRQDAKVFSFNHNTFRIEIFGQNKEVFQQNAYLHMIAEYRILLNASDNFRKCIIDLKKAGIKTEPAFGQLLKLKDPYEDLKKIASYSDNQIVELLGKYAK